MNKQRKTKNRQHRSMQILTYAAVAACATISAHELRADDPVRSASPAPAPPASTIHTFNIAPGTLTDVLEAYKQTTGINVNIKLPLDKLQGMQSPGVTGEMNYEAALRALLSKTGLSGHFLNAKQVEIAIRNEEQVDVQASMDAVSLTTFTEPLNNVAQTVNVVPQYIMQEQAVTQMRDGLRNVPGISIAAGEGGSQGDTLTIRGFNARNDIYLDGIRDFGSYYRDSFDYQAIEVIQGPASAEFGRGSTGGVVNQETKVPSLRQGIGGTLQLGTNAMRRITADVNEPMTNFVPNSAFRMNLVGSQSNIAGRDVTYNSRFGIAPSLAFGLNTSTRYFVNYLHEAENDLPDYGLPYFGVTAAAVPRSTYYGYVEGNYFKTNPDIMTGKVEHDFNEHFTLVSQLRFGNYPRDVQITEPQVNTTPVYTASATGELATCSTTAATPCFPVNTSLTSVLVKRNQIQVKSTEDDLWEQTAGTTRFKIAKMDNTAVVILEGGRERSTPQRYTFPATLFTPALNPNPGDILSAALVLGAKTHVVSTSYGIGFSDTLKVREWLQFSGGVRFDYFNTQSNVGVTPSYVNGTTTVAAVPASASNRLDKVPTYRAAVVVKPRSNGSVYFDYGTSFNPSAESLSLTAANATQAPQMNTTYETGTKWSFMRERLNVNGAYFQTTKDNVYETDPTNTLNVIPVGDQRVRGAQFGLLGHLPGHFDLIAGYAYLDGRTISSIANYSPFAAYYKAGDPIFGQAPYIMKAIGNPFANVPKNSANLWVTHDLKWGFVGGFGFNEIGARRASSTGPIPLLSTSTPTNVANIPVAFKVIPGYWSFNAMLRKTITDHIDFQANIVNLTNAFFIDQPHPNHLIPSEGINAQFGFNYKF